MSLWQLKYFIHKNGKKQKQFKVTNLVVLRHATKPSFATIFFTRDRATEKRNRLLLTRGLSWAGRSVSMETVQLVNRS